MKKIVKILTQYIFNVIPIAAIFLTIHFGSSLGHINTKTRTLVINNASVLKSSKPLISGLPCGYVAKGGIQQPEQPTFTTNSAIPVLQYPAGNYPGTTDQVPDAVYSDNQTDQLILQSDGNLVIYCTSCVPAKALWSSQTNGKDCKTLFFQNDGDLVLRDSFGKMVWHSNIHSKCAGSEQAYFKLQDDGNLVMLYNEDVAGSSTSNAAVASPVTVDIQPPSNSTDVGKVVAVFLGGTGSTNAQVKSPHPGKIQ